MVNIKGDDRFFVLGVHAVIERLYREMAVRFMSVSALPDIWVFTKDTLTELQPFIQQLHYGQPCIVFGAQRHRRILSEIPGLEKLLFIDIGTSAMAAVSHIREAMRSGFRPGITFDPNYRRSRLTPKEQHILHHLLQGGRVDTVARLCGCTGKAVSSCKRRIMKKYNVFNNQELIIKSRILGNACHTPA
jgi:DNA-binding CsgD family transcriptional regulator